MSNSGKVIIVAGGAGFLGSHLCDRFLRDGYSVMSLDNFYTGKIQNIEHHKDNRAFLASEWDIQWQFGDRLALLQSTNVEAVVNMACPASPKHYQAEPIYTMMTNVFGTYNLLTIANALGARFIQSSTSEVYGDPLVHPQHENYLGNVNPIGIRSCYDEGKRAAEALCFDFLRKHKTDIGVARIFNTYGGRMAADDGRVVSNFITAALNDGELKIYGSGEQTRSFCFVDDMVEGLTKLTYAKGVTGPINLGNPTEFTIKELAELVIQKVGKGRITYVDAVQDDPQQRKPVITLAKELLDWSPTVNLSDGLDATIEYFKNKP
jgi:UDP-glucuronate decarboxylase